MAIKLEKKQGIKLTKDVAGVEETLKVVKLGCGWQASRDGHVMIPQTKTVTKRVGGFFGFGGTVQSEEVTTTERVYVGEIDIDATVFAFRGDRFVGECSYRNKRLSNGGKVVAQSSGDNRRGSTGKQDDETITINIENIDTYADTLYLVLNIFNAYNNGQHFNMVNNSYVRVYDDKGVEMAYFDLAEDYHNMTGVVVGKLHKTNGVFEFTALGDGVRVKGLDEFAKRVKQY